MNLDCVWTYDQTQMLDDQRAVARGHILSPGVAAFHGTWTRTRYFFLRSGDDGAFTVFDDAGGLAHFVRVGEKGSRDFSASTDALQFVASFTDGKPTTKITPSLVVTAYTAQDAPTQAAPGDLYIASSNDITKIGGQRIKVEQDGKTFTWSSPDFPKGIDFTPVPAQTGDPDGLPFRDVFAGASDWAQTAFPFYGFLPTKMLVYSEIGAYAKPGTPDQSVAYSDNVGQTFIAPLIFEFPEGGSHDYVRSLDLSHQPNLPIGRSWQQTPLKNGQEQSRMLSTLSDRMDSMSASFGFSAGVEGMFSAGANFAYHKKVEDQRENQSRYVVSRSINVRGINIIHVPSLALSSELIDKLHDLALDHVAGTPVDWGKVVNHFGTHYLHAMTYGELKYSETRISLEDEQHAETTGFDFKANAEATVDDAKVTSDGSYGEEWAQKIDNKDEKQDVSYYDIGGDGSDAIGIFYDLRPISELLSPLLIPYDPTTEWGSLAPWVWTKMRQQLEQQLTDMGMNQPMSDDLAANYRPRIFKITVQQITITPTYQPGHERDLSQLLVAGTFTVDVDSKKDTQIKLTATPALAVIPPVELTKINGLPLDGITFCNVLAKGGDHTHIDAKLHMAFGVASINWVMDVLDGDLGVAESAFSGDHVFGADVPVGKATDVDFEPVIGTNNVHVTGSEYALRVRLRFEDISAPGAGV